MSWPLLISEILSHVRSLSSRRPSSNLGIHDKNRVSRSTILLEALLLTSTVQEKKNRRREKRKRKGFLVNEARGINFLRAPTRPYWYWISFFFPSPIISEDCFTTGYKTLKSTPVNREIVKSEHRIEPSFFFYTLSLPLCPPPRPFPHPISITIQKIFDVIFKAQIRSDSFVICWYTCLLRFS